MLYAQNGFTDAKLRHDEHSKMIRVQGIKVNRPNSDPDLVRFMRMAGFLAGAEEELAGDVGAAESGRGGEEAAVVGVEADEAAPARCRRTGVALGRRGVTVGGEASRGGVAALAGEAKAAGQRHRAAGRRRRGEAAAGPGRASRGL